MQMKGLRRNEDATKGYIVGIKKNITHMRHLTIIVPDGENNLSSIVGAYKIFTRANEYWKESRRKELFKIQLAGISKEVEFYNGLFTVKPHTDISAITKTNLI